MFPFFPLYNLFVFRVFFGLCGVAALLGGVIQPCCSVKFFHVGLRVFIVVYAHVVLPILEVALHDRSVIVLLCEIQEVSRFLDFVLLPIFHTVTPMGVLQC